MIKTLEKLVKLSHFDIKSWILVELTEQEKALITKQRDETFSIGNLGYIDPSKVKRYFNSKLQQEFEGAPELRVRIDFEDQWIPKSLAGNYSFIHKNPEGETNLILYGPILVADIEQRKIDPKYVTEDNSGKIVPITKERIEQEIQRGIKTINKGYRENFLTAEKLSKLIGLDFSKQIEEARKYDKTKYLERYAQPENLETVLNELEDCSNLLFDQEYLEGTGKYEIIDEFLELLPQLDLPENFKARAIEFIEEYARSYQKAIEETKDEIKDKIKEAEESIRNLETEKQRILKFAEILKKE